jgi:hypothetical protein
MNTPPEPREIRDPSAYPLLPSDATENAVQASIVSAGYR